MTAFLYAGPTLARALAIRADLRLDDLRVLPPIRRGDLPGLVRAHAAGVVVIADGLFHAALAVGHAEIRDALAAGWRVHGVSSMGAIRASEMRSLGMIGFGAVFRAYCREDIDFRDDEVALLHDDAPPFRELSEPLVHLRALLAELASDGVIASAEADAVAAELAGMWFGERTLAFVASRLASPERRERVLAAIRDIDRHRVKAHDLIGFLDARAWLNDAGG